MLWGFRGNVGARAFLLCVSHASTALSKHEASVEPLFCFDCWDCGHACARGRGGRRQKTEAWRMWRSLAPMDSCKAFRDVARKQCS